ncbi:hypothetical protein BV25DRAFT_1912471 [Artomyces pyxidatus]|uniref:Uncharacterized protein n=1 Tax=Artomyces pyxidatus TaxID=48021 RepID=A0ACB8TDD7_9AGAM|nr:hypothetical protein BV25DRAFT_1912471 [Artomyces pyxidatus]
MARIRTLRLQVTKGSSARYLMRSLTRSAPELETLHINACPDPRDDHTSRFTTFPDNFLNNHAPKLRHLYSENSSNFPWTSTILKNLVILDVSGYGQQADLPSLDVLVRGLAETNFLETLSLSHCFFRHPSEAPPLEVVARLPFLKKLDLFLIIYDATAFLKQLDFPISAAPYLDLDCTPEPDLVDFLSLISALATHLQKKGANAVFTGLTFDYDSVAAVREVEGLPSPYTGKVMLQFNRASTEWHGFDLARAALDLLSSEQLRSLSVTDESNWTAETWSNISERAMGLRTLHLDHEATKSLCLSLPIPLSDSSSDAAVSHAARFEASKSPFLPAFKSLQFCDGSFVLSPYDHRHRAATEASQMMTNAVQAWVSERAKGSSPLMELVFRNCTVLTAWVDTLRESVAVVD